MVRFPIAYVTMTANLYRALQEPSAPPFQMITLCPSIPNDNPLPLQGVAWLESHRFFPPL